ncbi:MAG: sigma-70 family RNA polymerase sigma factor [Acidobacteriota bacterium]
MPSDSGHQAATASQEDEEILAAVRSLQAGAGSEAFAPIARRLLRPLTTFFANRPALKEQADDLAQDTLLRVYTKIDQYRFEAAFSTWVRQIAENVWKNAVRDLQAAKRGAPAEALDSAEDETGSLKVADPAPTPEARALAAERTRVLRSALDRLPEGMRLCTELRLVSDLKYREISEVTGIGLDTVRSQLFEARKRLKPVLEQYFQDMDF